MEETWTVKRILEWIEGYLASRNDPNPRLSAQWLLSSVLDCTRLELYTMFERILVQSECDILRDYTKRRGEGEPLQYITGTTDFRFLTLEVASGVLIPRPETEVLVSEALSTLDKSDPQEEILVIDLCTGSGNIACAIASECSFAKVLACDISSEACALARRNAASLGLEDRVEVYEGNLGDALPQEVLDHVDLVVSNPPYIPHAVLAELDREVADFEPALALDGGEDGLDIFRLIVPFSLDALRPGGILACELHETCLDAARAIAEDAGLKEVRVADDLAGKPRFLIAKAPTQS